MHSLDKLHRSAAACTALAVAMITAAAAQAEPAGGDDGVPAADVLSLLETHCAKCHGGEKTKGGLDLMTREGLLRGGETRPAIAVGKPETSLLLQTLRHEEEPHMPHKKEKLPEAAIARIEAWIKAGAPYSRPLNKAQGAAEKAGAGFSITDEDRSHWAFQPIKRSTLPPVRAAERARNPIDHFTLAKLEARGLSLSAEANKETLIRRVAFDLIGLPPAPREIDAFVNDPSPSAYERLLERLLASPHYGERWGRHWLDLARFAETDGFEHDAVRPHSWRYRDYVIGAFNADKPYDRFIREQIAGDELWPGQPEALIATGFNLLGPDMVDSSDQVQRRHNTLNDMTDTASLVFLGLTMGCARCHDHKFEPISQRDYYSLQACFAPAAFQREQPIPTPAERAAHDSAMRAYHEHPTVRALAAIEEPLREKVRQKKLAKLSPEAQAAHRTPPAQRTAEEANLVLETEPMVAVNDRDLVEVRVANQRTPRQELQEQLKRLPKPEPLPKAMALGAGDRALKTFVLHRGEYSQPGEEIAAAVPAVLRSGEGVPSLSSRARLAEWIASPENPLTARVMVNRIWQHHFGRGIVATPSDFGARGRPPTHPELLDYMASRFVQSGWSVKAMHRLIMHSRAYQSAVRDDSAGAATDPDNHLLWTFEPRRLSAEEVRDSMLSVSGALDRTPPQGPHPFPPENEWKYTQHKPFVAVYE
ncbi:MAG: PSD1 and planctomycete cytochrome C domain-containing protein, partial [Verrucomicrobiota bacterium]|nr:PSD1 and planctomycete cytochrome C domain-containing protein [Verrucomicrobiota bacterium]